MCFLLYAGTSKPMPRKELCKDAPELSITTLTEHDKPITAHFSKLEVQYIGSTSGCGCDFPYVMFQNGDWPWFEDMEADELDRQQKETEQNNRAALVELLRHTGEPKVELYGVWDGNFALQPAAHEEIHLKTILNPAFRFKEQGFYIVDLT